MTGRLFRFVAGRLFGEVRPAGHVGVRDAARPDERSRRVVCPPAPGAPLPGAGQAANPYPVSPVDAARWAAADRLLQRAGIDRGDS